MDRGELANSYTDMVHKTKMALYIIINRSVASYVSRRLIMMCTYVAIKALLSIHC